MVPAPMCRAPIPAWPKHLPVMHTRYTDSNRRIDRIKGFSRNCIARLFLSGKPNKPSCGRQKQSRNGNFYSPNNNSTPGNQNCWHFWFPCGILYGDKMGKNMMPADKKTYSCIIVDDKALDRLAVQAFLRNYPFMELAGSFASAGAALEHI